MNGCTSRSHPRTDRRRRRGLAAAHAPRARAQRLRDLRGRRRQLRGRGGRSRRMQRRAHGRRDAADERLRGVQGNPRAPGRRAPADHDGHRPRRRGVDQPVLPGGRDGLPRQAHQLEPAGPPRAIPGARRPAGAGARRERRPPARDARRPARPAARRRLARPHRRPARRHRESSVPQRRRETRAEDLRAGER